MFNKNDIKNMLVNTKLNIKFKLINNYIQTIDTFLNKNNNQILKFNCNDCNITKINLIQYIKNLNNICLFQYNDFNQNDINNNLNIFNSQTLLLNNIINEINNDVNDINIMEDEKLLLHTKFVHNKLLLFFVVNNNYLKNIDETFLNSLVSNNVFIIIISYD